MFGIFKHNHRERPLQLEAVNSHLDNISFQLTDSGAGMWITITGQDGQPRRGVYITRHHAEKIRDFLENAFLLQKK
jgi:hypothetical protein